MRAFVALFGLILMGGTLITGQATADSDSHSADLWHLHLCGEARVAATPDRPI
jgi:hypothetical protein